MNNKLEQIRISGLFGLFVIFLLLGFNDTKLWWIASFSFLIVAILTIIKVKNRKS